MYIVHLRGNAHKSGEQRRKEGGNVFEGASKDPIAIAFLVKNPAVQQRGQIFFHDIGDYLSSKEKKERIRSYASIAAIASSDSWQRVNPDAHGDWLKQRDESFSEFIALGDKKGSGPKLLASFSQGVLTARDAWCYSPSKLALADNMQRAVEHYNAEAARFNEEHGARSRKERDDLVHGFVNTDPTRISWTHNLKEELTKDRPLSFDPRCLTPSLYRPFCKQWLYYDRRWNERVYQMPRIFPDASAENIVIGVSASESRSGYSVMITNAVVSFHAADMVGSQYFPLYLYDEADEASNEIPKQSGLFTSNGAASVVTKRRDAITDEGFAHFRAAYPEEIFGKEDIFYYVYGLLHAPDYLDRFADNLGKELPRIPCVKSAADFLTFSRAGRALAELHLNYESVPLPSGVKVDDGGKPLTDAEYRVEKMRYGKKGKDKDLSTVIYNARITVKDIPIEAYGYVVNGRPAIDWVIERQCVKTDKDSGIVSDANDWAIETMNNPRYPLELLLRVVTVSLETMKIVKSLPPMVL